MMRKILILIVAAIMLLHIMVSGMRADPPAIPVKPTYTIAENCALGIGCRTIWIPNVQR